VRRLLIDHHVLSRRRLVRALRAAVEAVEPVPPTGSWTSYRNASLRDIADTDWTATGPDPRPEKIRELMQRVKARTVLDVGANDGYFAAMAAVGGAKVLAVDSDEGAIDKFNKWVTDTDREVEAFACVGTFHKLTQKAELVLALALAHHLVLSQQYKFDYVAARLASMSSRALITEFMPNGLGGNRCRPDPLPAHYRLELFLAELRKHFAEVEVVGYERPKAFSPRTLIFCDGRHAG
jgi:hypothetical protein